MEFEDVYEISKRTFLRDVRAYLNNIDTTSGHEGRATIAYDLFNHLYDNMEFVEINPNFRQAVLERATAIKKDIETGNLAISLKTRKRLIAAIDRVREAIEGVAQ